MKRSQVMAAGAGGFVVAAVGMVMIIEVLPLAALERAVVGGLLFPALWVASIVGACLRDSGRAAWRLQGVLIASMAVIAAIGWAVRS